HAALQGLISTHQRDWDDWLSTAEAKIRFVPHDSTSVSPYRVMYGYDPRLPIDNILVPANTRVRTPRTEADHVKDSLRELHDTVRANIELEQVEQKKEYNKHHRPVGPEMDVGKWVWKKITDKPEPGTSAKLRLAYTGPFVILEKTTPLNRIIAHVSNRE